CQGITNGSSAWLPTPQPPLLHNCQHNCLQHLKHTPHPFIHSLPRLAKFFGP
ncbi:hypothetical protein TYRP_002986, partial [Tyrophagus putrescentiae]